MADIYIQYGKNALEMTLSLLEAAGVSHMLQPDMRVVLKPNLVVSRPADEGATTHPEIAEGVILFLQRHNVCNIAIAEGSWVGDSTNKAFQRCGYEHLSKTYQVPLVDTKQDSAVELESNGLKLIVCKTFLEADLIINLPVLKSHCQTGMTCCLKNLKGCIPDSEKQRYHRIGLHRPIAALAAVLKPQLHLIDSICGDLTFEEGGNPVEQNRILLGFDGVLLDSFCAGLLGYRPDEIHHVSEAARYGAGRIYDDQTVVEELNPALRLCTQAPVSRVAQKLASHVLEDGACSACYAALLFALNRAGTHRLAGEKIRIGQHYRGKQLPGPGAGDCTAGFEKHVPGCPVRAVDVVDFLNTLYQERA